MCGQGVHNNNMAGVEEWRGWCMDESQSVYSSVLTFPVIPYLLQFSFQFFSRVSLHICQFLELWKLNITFAEDSLKSKTF